MIRSIKILVTLTLLSNCTSSSNNLEFKIIEEAIPEVLLPSYSHLVTEVSCPEHINEDLGTVFCTLQVSGKDSLLLLLGAEWCFVCSHEPIVVITFIEESC